MSQGISKQGRTLIEECIRAVIAVENTGACVPYDHPARLERMSSKRKAIEALEDYVASLEERDEISSLEESDESTDSVPPKSEVDIDVLVKLHGLPDRIATCLKNCGWTTLESFQDKTRTHLQWETGLNNYDVDVIVKSIRSFEGVR